MKKKYIKYIIYVLIIIVLLALFLAFWRSDKDACTLSLEACFLKNKIGHGAIGKFFADAGCVWNNMICVIKSLF